MSSAAVVINALRIKIENRSKRTFTFLYACLAFRDYFIFNSYNFQRFIRLGIDFIIYF